MNLKRLALTAKAGMRSCQVSLRWLLAIPLLSGVILGFYMWQVRLQREVVQAIRLRSGCVAYDSEMRPSALSLAFDPLGRALGPDFCSNVVWVRIENYQGEVDDELLCSMRRLHRLEGLEMRCPNVSDSGLSQLAGLQRLKYLKLKDAHVSARAILELKKALPECTVAQTD
jgi:hypothetical protein